MPSRTACRAADILRHFGFICPTYHSVGGCSPFGRRAGSVSTGRLTRGFSQERTSQMTVTRPRILVVDDDPKVLSLMQRGLAFEGYDVDVAPDGDEGLSVAHVRPPHLVVLDVMMPGVDGLEVCRRLRAVDRDLAILMLTGRASVPARIEGLDAGADDYLVKPFAFDELLARIRALLRRTLPDDHETLELDDLRLVPATRDVTRAGVPVELTAREFELLEFFMRHPRQVLQRDLIFSRVWGSDFMGESNVIDVHVMRLRDKLETGGGARLIHTIRGAGYSLRRPA
jgi:two-component system, OmpR family, response regulator MprA